MLDLENHSGLIEALRGLSGEKGLAADGEDLGGLVLR